MGVMLAHWVGVELYATLPMQVLQPFTGSRRLRVITRSGAAPAYVRGR